MHRAIHKPNCKIQGQNFLQYDWTFKHGYLKCNHIVKLAKKDKDFFLNHVRTLVHGVDLKIYRKYIFFKDKII